MAYQEKEIELMTQGELEDAINRVEKDIAEEAFFDQVSCSLIRMRANLYFIANKRGLHKYFYDQVILSNDYENEQFNGFKHYLRRENNE
jgi:hypothetical protein